jgi:DNA-binding PadR family transcriptional regulator
VSEARLLSLVAAHPHPRDLARRAEGSALFPGLRRLERAGLVTRRRGLYRVTVRGRSELALRVCIVRALAA